MTKFTLIQGGKQPDAPDEFDNAVDEMIRKLDAQHDEMARALIRRQILRFAGDVGLKQAIRQLQTILAELIIAERNSR